MLVIAISFMIIDNVRAWGQMRRARGSLGRLSIIVIVILQPRISPSTTDRWVERLFNCPRGVGIALYLVSGLKQLFFIFSLRYTCLVTLHTFPGAVIAIVTTGDIRERQIASR